MNVFLVHVQQFKLFLIFSTGAFCGIAFPVAPDDLIGAFTTRMCEFLGSRNT
jgi:hypothetical protein